MAAVLLTGMILAVVGLAGLVAGWVTRWKILTRLRVVFVALVGVGLWATASCSVCGRGDGSFWEAEFQLTFQDANGNPIEGIELRVEDPQGHNYFHYPVDDYVPDNIPTSDRNGLMVFHHVSSGLEFSVTTYDLFFFKTVTDPPIPAFTCRFLHNGEEVYRVPFRELDRREGTWEQVAQVKRRWQPPPWPEVLPHPGESSESWHDRLMALSDRNGNGRLDPEEAAAHRAANTYANGLEEGRSRARFHSVTEDEEIEFPVVRKTVSVQ